MVYWAPVVGEGELADGWAGEPLALLAAGGSLEAYYVLCERNFVLAAVELRLQGSVTVC